MDHAWLKKFDHRSPRVSDLNPWQKHVYQTKNAFPMRAKINNHSAFGKHQTHQALHRYYSSPEFAFRTVLDALGPISQFTGRAPMSPPFMIEDPGMASVFNSLSDDILPTGFGHLNDKLEGGFRRGEMTMVVGRGPDPELMRLLEHQERMRLLPAFAFHHHLQRNKDQKK
jgi:hypothetical protein